MYRIEDTYNWKTLKHWKIAMKKENVQSQTLANERITNILLTKAVMLLKEDLFPVPIMCYRGENGQKKILLTSLWTGIFDFLDDKRWLINGKEKVYFSTMTDDEQQSILKAQILSIWVTGELTDNYTARP